MSTNRASDGFGLISSSSGEARVQNHRRPTDLSTVSDNDHSPPSASTPCCEHAAHQQEVAGQHISDDLLGVNDNATISRSKMDMALLFSRQQIRSLHNLNEATSNNA